MAKSLSGLWLRSLRSISKTQRAQSRLMKSLLPKPARNPTVRKTPALLPKPPGGACESSQICAQARHPNRTARRALARQLEAVVFFSDQPRSGGVWQTHGLLAVSAVRCGDCIGAAAAGRDAAWLPADRP